MANLSSGSTVGGSPILTVNDLQTLQSNYFIAQGTKMLFQQTFAPTGWVKDTTHNNKALRVVTGTAGSGGSNAFSTAFNSHTSSTSSAGSHSHTSSTSSAGAHSHTIKVNSHTLTISQIPSHNHEQALRLPGNVPIGSGGEGIVGIATQHAGTWYTTSVGGSSGHDHGASSGSSGAHTHSVYTGSSGAHTHTLNLNVQYVDLIIATKDSGNYFFD